MSAISTDVTLKIEGNDLYVGQTKVPINRTRLCWFYEKDNIVQVISKTARGGVIQGSYSIHLPTAAKVQECIQLLIENTKTHIDIPTFNELRTEPTQVTFIFADKSRAEKFTYYAPAFFPKSEFELKLDGKRCQLICNPNQTDTVDKIKRALNKLDERSYDHAVSNALFKNEDPQFPGKYYPKKPDREIQFDFRGDRERNFVVTQEKIEATHWGDNFQKYTTPSNYEEVTHWINHRKEEEILQDRTVWENLLKDLKEENDSELSGLTKAIETMLTGDNFEKTIEDNEKTLADETLYIPLLEREKINSLIRKNFK